jgi:hypothetical protein
MLGPVSTLSFDGLFHPGMGEQISEPPAIACTLPPAEFKARLTAIAELNAA